MRELLNKKDITIDCKSFVNLMEKFNINLKRPHITAIEKVLDLDCKDKI
jgi:hypothetical protein